MEAKTENTLKQLWNLADARRGDRPLDALALLVQLAESGDRDSLTPELIDGIARTSFARHQMGNGFTAASVSHFFAALARTRPVDSILDPTCGSGLLMKQVADATGAKVVHGVEIDPRPLELARAVHGNGAEITLGDFFEVEPNLHRQYDLIIGDLPLGMTMRDPREITRKRFTASDLSEAITYLGVRALGEEWPRDPERNRPHRCERADPRARQRTRLCRNRRHSRPQRCHARDPHPDPPDVD